MLPQFPNRAADETFRFSGQTDVGMRRIRPSPPLDGQTGGVIPLHCRLLPRAIRDIKAEKEQRDRRPAEQQPTEAIRWTIDAGSGCHGVAACFRERSREVATS